jgi:5-methylcytosine-specific restriction endonuclease McrA
MARQLYGADNPNWRGGTSAMGRQKAPAWRRRVLERDQYRCTQCGRSDDLHAHHIHSYVDHPEMRDRVENGVTLCGPCHRLSHRLDRATAHLSAAVRTALEAGWTHARVSEATGLTRSRIGKIALTRKEP